MVISIQPQIYLLIDERGTSQIPSGGGNELSHESFSRLQHTSRIRDTSVASSGRKLSGKSTTMLSRRTAARPWPSNWFVAALPAISGSHTTTSLTACAYLLGFASTDAIADVTTDTDAPSNSRASSLNTKVRNNTRTAEACILEPSDARKVARNEGATFNTSDTSSAFATTISRYFESEEIKEQGAHRPGALWGGD
jgi:hypothetical protein